jgi:CHRD domain
MINRILRSSVLAAALAAAVLAPHAALAKPGKQLTFMSVLNGGQVVPPSTSNSMGVGFLTFDPSAARLCYSITYSPLLGNETEAHLHGDALPGETSAVLYDLNPLGTPKVGCIGSPLKPNEVSLLKRGRMYIQIHTDIFVAGEIRGQVVPLPSVR